MGLRATCRVVAAVWRVGSRILLAQRPAGKVQAGLWEFPGGKIEAAESDADALKRECLEELGVHVQVGPLLGEYTQSYVDLEVTVVFYGVASTGIATGREAQAVAWVELKKLLSMPLCEVDRAFAIERLDVPH